MSRSALNSDRETMLNVVEFRDFLRVSRRVSEASWYGFRNWRFRLSPYLASGEHSLVDADDCTDVEAVPEICVELAQVFDYIRLQNSVMLFQKHIISACERNIRNTVLEVKQTFYCRCGDQRWQSRGTMRIWLLEWTRLFPSIAHVLFLLFWKYHYRVQRFSQFFVLLYRICNSFSIFLRFV